MERRCKRRKHISQQMNERGRFQRSHEHSDSVFFGRRAPYSVQEPQRRTSTSSATSCRRPRRSRLARHDGFHWAERIIRVTGLHRNHER